MRRYADLHRSVGTRWPDDVRRDAMTLHGGCIGPAVGMTGPCSGGVELDHIRASGGIGMKSRSTLDNAAPLCGVHHREKTENGRAWRPKLIAHVDRAMSAVERPACCWRDGCSHNYPTACCVQDGCEHDAEVTSA